MVDGAATGSLIVVESWAVLVAAGSLFAAMIGGALGIIFHIGGRIDHQSDRIDRIAEELALVRERVARLEGSSGTPGPGPLQLA